MSSRTAQYAFAILLVKGCPDLCIGMSASQFILSDFNCSPHGEYYEANGCSLFSFVVPRAASMRSRCTPKMGTYVSAVICDNPSVV